MKESTFLGLGSLLYLRSSLLVLHIIINKLTTKEKQRDLLCSCLTITPLDWYTDWGTNDKYWRSHTSAPWAAFNHQGQIRPSLTKSYPTRLSVSFILGPVLCIDHLQIYVSITTGKYSVVMYKIILRIMPIARQCVERLRPKMRSDIGRSSGSL